MRTFAQKPKAPQQATPAKPPIPARAHFGPSQEVSVSLHLQRTIGNQAVQRLLQANPEELNASSDITASSRFAHDFSRIPVHSYAPGSLQPKLMVNTPGDIHEQEADRISEQVMRMPEPQLQRVCPCGGGCPKCQTEQPGREPESLQTKRRHASDTGQYAAPPIVHEVLRSPGQPLDPATRAFMEPRFGHDFGKVRVHTDARAAKSADAVGAVAYAAGSGIVFASGHYRPNAAHGLRLIAHELAHTVQQLDYGPPRLFRQPNPGGMAPVGGATPRIVFIDNDVLSEIATGNRTAARDVMAMRRAGVDLRIWRGTYNEAVRAGGKPYLSGARRLIVQELNIRIDDGPGLASRVGTYAAPQAPAAPQKDLPMMAAARATGGAELWSYDGGVQNSAARIGVALAPESAATERVPQGRADVRAGLNNVGLQDWTVDVNGAANRTSSGTLGGRPKAPAPGTPPAQTPASSSAGQTPAVGTVKPSVTIRLPEMKLRGLPEMKLRGVVRSGLMALLTIVAGKLIGDVTQNFVDSQVKDLQPEIEKRVRREAEWGLAAYNRQGRGIPLYINVTLDVMTDSSIDPDLRQRLYGAPSVSIEAVAIDTRNRDGETSHKQDIRAFVMFDHQYFTFSIPLESLIEQSGPASASADDRVTKNPPD